MDIPVTPKLAQRIQDKVSSGIYGNTDEVISEALRLLDERDMYKMRGIEMLKKDIDEGYRIGGRHDLDVQEIIRRKTDKKAHDC